MFKGFITGVVRSAVSTGGPSQAKVKTNFIDQIGNYLPTDFDHIAQGNDPTPKDYPPQGTRLPFNNRDANDNSLDKMAFRVFMEHFLAKWQERNRTIFTKYGCLMVGLQGEIIDTVKENIEQD